MAEIFHMIGLCPDHFTHSNLIEFCLTNSQEFSWICQKVNLSLIKLKIKKYGQH
jgi:hypothetical protein